MRLVLCAKRQHERVGFYEPPIESRSPSMMCSMKLLGSVLLQYRLAVAQSRFYCVARDDNWHYGDSITGDSITSITHYGDRIQPVTVTDCSCCFQGPDPTGSLPPPNEFDLETLLINGQDVGDAAFPHSRSLRIPGFDSRRKHVGSTCTR